MRFISTVIVMSAVSLAWPASARCQLIVPIKPSELEVKSRRFIDLLVKGDFAKARADFDDTMNKVLPADKLKELWMSVTERVGPLQKQLEARFENKTPYDIVYVACQFKSLALDIKLVFDAKKRLSGLSFALAKSKMPYKVPAYVRQQTFQETEVKFGLKNWILPGTLTIPRGKGPFAAIVLVHGSGPNDRDETIGPNKPLKDLAWGLASQGLAVLRYEKRTREHAAKFVAAKTSPTLNDEVIDDALSAVAFLRRQPAIDAKRIFVLGHSLGATLAPSIGAAEPAIAGLILLAGATRPVDELVLEQLTYIYSLKGKLSKKERQELDRIKQQIDKIKAATITDKLPLTDRLLGVSPGYWLELRQAQKAATVLKAKQPMLILQGERDYQVTMLDFAGWKKLYADRKNVVFKSYPKLNHLFMSGQGKSRPEEYLKQSTMDGTVVADIARWIKSRKMLKTGKIGSP